MQAASIDRALLRIQEWRDHPEEFLDEEVDAPTPLAMERAISLLNHLRVSPVDVRSQVRGVSMGGGGEISVEVEGVPPIPSANWTLAETFRISPSGQIEQLVFLNNRLRMRNPYSLPEDLKDSKEPLRS